MNSVHLAVASGALAMALVAGSAVADNISEVKVEASRIVTSTPSGRTSSGIPVVNLSLTYGVSLADLDLSTHTGATEAMRRVNAAADSACKELGRQYPDATPDDKQCAKAASDKAMIVLNKAIRGAEQARK